MTFSPNHPAVRAWQATRKCNECGAHDLPVVRKYDTCAECKPLSVRERTNMVHYRAGRPLMRAGLKSRTFLGLVFFIAGCYALEYSLFATLVMYGLCFTCWNTGLNRWLEEQGL